MAFTDFTNCLSCKSQVKMYDGGNCSGSLDNEEWTFKCGAMVMLWKGEYTVRSSCTTHYESLLKKFVKENKLEGES